MGRLKDWVIRLNLKKLTIVMLSVTIIAGASYLVIDSTDSSSTGISKILFSIKMGTEDVLGNIKEFFIPKELLGEKGKNKEYKIDYGGKRPSEVEKSTRVEGESYGIDMKAVADLMKENSDFECYVDWSKGHITDTEYKQLNTILSGLILRDEGAKVVVSQDVNSDYSVDDSNTVSLPVLIKEVDTGKEYAKTYKLAYKYNYLEIVD